MKILFVTSFYYPDTMGGSDRYLFEVTTRLARLGHEVTVMTAKQGDEFQAYERIEDIEVYRYNLNRSSSLRYYLSSIFNAQALGTRLLREHRYDLVVLSHILPSFGMYLADKKIPKVYHYYASYLLEYRDKLKWLVVHKPSFSLVVKLPFLKMAGIVLRRIEKYLVWKTKKIMVLSEYSKGELETVYQQGHKAAIIPSGVAIERFKPLGDKTKIRQEFDIPTDRPVLLTIRRLYHRMGLEELLLALKEVKKVIPDIVLLIGGKGPLLDKLKKDTAEYGIEENVRFLGFIAEKDIAGYYNAADYFILPSRALEGFGLVTLEALACGLPVLGTPVGATPKLLRSLEPELVFEDSSARGMASKIITMLGDYQGYEQLSERCCEYAQQNFNWDKIIPKIEQFYQATVL